MEIHKIKEAELNKVCKFIARQNSNERYFVAWLDTEEKTIKNLLLSLTDIPYQDCCLVLMEGSEIKGFWGFYAFKEQKVIRLLGPFIEDSIWDKHIDQLWAKMLQLIPDEYRQAKISFYDSNKRCKEFSEKQGFINYNAEKTLTITKPKGLLKQKIPGFRVAQYGCNYYKGLVKLHPEKAYFSVTDIINNINENNSLLVGIIDQAVVGYIYFEMNNETNLAELCFVNVAESYRGKGIGTALIDRVLEICFSENSISEIDISVRVNNQRAEKLYKRLGFIEKNIIYGFSKELY